MSANFRSSYSELLGAGLKYTHSGTPVNMHYRESEDYPSLEQIQRINQERKLKHHVLQIKLSEMQEQRPATPPAFRELSAQEIEKIVDRLNDTKTTASSGQLDQISALRIERASKKNGAKVYGNKKSNAEEQRELVERLSTPNVMSKLRLDAVLLQHGVSRESKKEEKRDEPKEKTKPQFKPLKRTKSWESVDSMASNRTA